MVMLLRVKPLGVVSCAAIDEYDKVCYYVAMFKNIKNYIKDKYYRYQPGEFFPIRSGSELLNKREFHKYRIKWIMNNRRVFVYQLTHHAG